MKRRNGLVMPALILLGLLESHGADRHPSAPGHGGWRPALSRGNSLRIRGGGQEVADPISYGNEPIIDAMTNGWWSRSKWIRDNKLFVTPELEAEVEELGCDFGRSGDVGKALQRLREDKKLLEGKHDDDDPEEEGEEGEEGGGEEEEMAATPGKDGGIGVEQGGGAEMTAGTQDDDSMSVWSQEYEEEEKEAMSEPDLQELATIKGLKDGIDCARQDFDEALKEDPNNVVAINNLASLLTEYPEHQTEAEALFRRGLLIEPESTVLRGNLGFMLSQRERDAAAHNEAEEIFVAMLGENAEDIATLNNYALFQSNVRGNHTFARELLERAARADDEVIVTLGNLAMLAHKHLREDRFVDNTSEVGAHYDMSGVEFARALTLKTLRLDPAHAWVQENAHKIILDPAHKNSRLRDSDYEHQQGVGLTRLNRTSGRYELIDAPGVL
jgi:Tfp pilus assembly protein PilF